MRKRRCALHFCHSRVRCSFLSPSPLGGRGKGEGGCWRHLEPLGASPLSLRLRLRGASPLSLILSPGGGEESGKEGACPSFVIPARLTSVISARPTAVIPARCAFLFPSPLGGRGKGEGGCWRHLEPLGTSPLSLRLRLRGASPPLLDPLPRWGRGIRKRGCVPQFCHPRAPHCRHPRAPHCRHSRARLTCLPRLPVRARRQTGRTRRRQASGSAIPRRRPSPSPLPCNGHAREGKKKVRRARG
jgi:hypothetical protein